METCVSGSIADLIADLQAENARLKHALSVYQSALGGVLSERGAYTRKERDQVFHIIDRELAIYEKAAIRNES